jgi:TetR/AcrR family transcriptional regulator, regulator of mycofactocin system
VPGRRVPGRPGRRPATSHEEIARVGLQLFAAQGFDAVSVDDIAAAAGVGRRTLFRYYPSKNDILWGTFDDHLRDWERWIDAETTHLSLMPAIRAAVLHFNSYGPDVMAGHRLRMSLILANPALQAHATLRYERWRAVIARLAASRLGSDASDFRPAVLAHLTLGAALASYEQWLRDPQSDLLALLNQALDVLAGPAQIDGAAEVS